MVLPLYAQILTGDISGSGKISTTFSLNLDWNESGGLNGIISRVDPTGEVLAPITGAGIVQSRLVLIEFPGHGSFRGHLSEDRSVLKGRLLFRENPASRAVVRRFTLYRYGGTGGAGGTGEASLTIKLVLSQAVGSVSSGDIDLHAVSPADGTNTIVRPVP